MRGGIVGKEMGRIRADGDVRAQFVENAHIQARGDVVVRDSIVQSVVSAEGRVVTTEGKGRIVGGSITAHKGIEVNELGSEAATGTLVNAGLDAKSIQRMAALQKELSLYRRNKKKLSLSLALLTRKAKQRTIAAHEVVKLERLVKFRREAMLAAGEAREIARAQVGEAYRRWVWLQNRLHQKLAMLPV